MPACGAAPIAVIGGGPAGLMAAQVAVDAGHTVDLYDRMGSVGRKFLVAGKGGLNLTHSEPSAAFVRRYGAREQAVGGWLADFDADAVRDWARGLGVETFVGSSGRVFPLDLKAAPLLRGWVRRLRERGVRFHTQHRWLGWSENEGLRFAVASGERVAEPAAATVLALGGGSWARLGSDGGWTDTLRERGVSLAALQPSNCGFDIGGRRLDGSLRAVWTTTFATRFAGAPLKPVVIVWTAADGSTQRLQGECVVTATGLEGSAIYAISAALRDAIARDGEVVIALDLAPGREPARLARDLARPRNGRTLTEHLRRSAGIGGVKAGLLYELLDRTEREDPGLLAARIKALPLTLARARPIDEAISTAGGVCLPALDGTLMLRALPGTFCAGEMLDWEAPTGGYLLTACLASGRRAGQGAVAWLKSRGDNSQLMPQRKL